MSVSANTSNLGDFYAAAEDTKQNSNNVRENSNKTQKDTGINEKTRYGKLLAFIKKVQSQLFSKGLTVLFFA